MHLAIAPDEVAVRPDQVHRVEAARRPVFARQFGVAEREADPEAGRGIVEALRLRPRHRPSRRTLRSRPGRRSASAERRSSAPSRETQRSRRRRPPPAPEVRRAGRPSRRARRFSGSGRSGRPRWSGHRAMASSPRQVCLADAPDRTARAARILRSPAGPQAFRLRPPATPRTRTVIGLPVTCLPS